MMEPERKARAVRMLRTLRQDLEEDVLELEGAKFTAQNVSIALGQMAAQIDALANVLIELMEEGE